MSFTVEMSSPFEEGADGNFYGGPGQGGHTGPQWYIAAGMDIGAPVGTEVRAVFDGVVTDFKTPASSGSEYGHQVWIRAISAELDPNAPNGVGAFYTHLVTRGIAKGLAVTRGQVIGTITSFAGIPTHLHLAIAERRGGTNFGVDLYDTFQKTVNTVDVFDVEFQEDGTPPSVSF